MITEAPRADDCYNPRNEMEFKEWTASMGRLTANPDGWENFHFAIRRADGMVLYIENFKAVLHSQVQQAAQESGLVSASDNRTRTLPRPAQHSAHARPPLSHPMLIPSRTPRNCHNSGSLLLLLSPQGGSMDNIRNYLIPRGAPPWNFKDYSQPYVTPLTNKIQDEPHPRQHLGRELREEVREHAWAQEHRL